MQLVVRVLVLAVGIFSAYSFPHIANNHLGSNEAIYELITAQVRSVLIDTHAMSPAQIVCADRFNYQMQTVNNDATNQTNACFDNANRTTTENNAIANATVDSIKKDLFTVQWQLANCTNQNDTNLFVNCTTATFDSNLALLDRANSNSYTIIAQVKVNQTQVDYVRSACVSVAMSNAKLNTTTVANDYTQCLDNISKHRDEPELLLTGN